MKFSKWGFYLLGEGPQQQSTMKDLRIAASTRTVRVPKGAVGTRHQPLVLKKVSKNKVVIAYPLAVSRYSCVHLLKLALGNNWRKVVTDPAGVQGANQAAAAEEGAVAAEAAGDKKEEKKNDKKEEKKEKEEKKDKKGTKNKKPTKQPSSDGDSDCEPSSDGDSDSEPSDEVEETPKKKKGNMGKA